VILLADGVCRTGILLTLLSKFCPAKYFANESFKLYEIVACFKPSIRSEPWYIVMMWLRVGLNPDMVVLREAYNWVLPLHLPKFKARLLTHTIITHCFPTISHGFNSAPCTPNGLLPPDLQKNLLILCDELDEAITNSGYRNPVGGCGVVASAASLADLALSALRHWILWDIETAYMDIAECAIQAPLVHEAKIDCVILNIAAVVAVQLVGLCVVQYREEGFFEDMKEYCGKNESEKKICRMINLAEILLKFSQISRQPWGKYLVEWNKCVLKNFVIAWNSFSYNDVNFY